MNKDGGLSVFDVKSNTTKEILDNTTFVSICTFQHEQLQDDTMLVLGGNKRCLLNLIF